MDIRAQIAIISGSITLLGIIISFLINWFVLVRFQRENVKLINNELHIKETEKLEQQKRKEEIEEILKTIELSLLCDHVKNHINTSFISRNRKICPLGLGTDTNPGWDKELGNTPSIEDKNRFEMVKEFIIHNNIVKITKSNCLLMPDDLYDRFSLEFVRII